MTTHHHFIAAILCQLGDATPVLLYSDWLEEQGDEECAWWRGLAEALRAARIGRQKMTMELGEIHLAREAWRTLPKGTPVRMGRQGESFVVKTNDTAEIAGYVRKQHCTRRDGWYLVTVAIFAPEIAFPEAYRSITAGLIPSVLFGNIQARTGSDRIRVHLPTEQCPATITRTATLPLSRLAPGVRRLMESHPDT